MDKAQAGKLGGLATLNKYGKEFFVINGAKGGRPRDMTLDELRQHQSLEAQQIDRGGMDTLGYLPNNLAELKRLYKLHRKSGGSEQNENGRDDVSVEATVIPAGKGAD